MNEQEILTQLRKAAEEIEIPEALKPEQIEKQLQEQKAKQQQENQHLKPKKSKKIIPWRRLGSMVAVLALVVCRADGFHSNDGYAADCGRSW